jgi:hypothetical protein
VSFTLQGSPLAHDAEWEIQGTAPDLSLDVLNSRLNHDAAVKLEGRSDVGRHLLVPEVQHLSLMGLPHAHFTGVAPELRIDSQPLGAVPSSQVARVFLTSTPLALPEHNLTVQARTGVSGPLRDEEPRAVFHVETALGAARLALRYAWSELDTVGYRAAVRVPVPTIELSIADARLSQDLASLLRSLAEEVEDILDVLSLFSRRFVRWTRMELESVIKVGHRPQPVLTEWIRTVSWDPGGHGRVPMVHAQRMPLNALSRVVQRYRQDPQKRYVHDALINCVAAEEAGYLETSFTTAFISIEALLHAFGARDAALVAEENRFDANQLQKRLLTVLDEFGHEANLSSVTRQSLEKGIRRAVREGRIAARIAAMIHSASVEWRDLWPDGTELVEGLRHAVNRRNEYFHEGRFPESDVAFADFNRLRLLAERLLFVRLGSDATWQTQQNLERGRAQKLASSEL